MTMASLLATLEVWFNKWDAMISPFQVKYINGSI
jgi:hypothetical protein